MPAPATISKTDLVGPVRLLVQTNGQALTPQAVTPTDVRQYRQHMLTGAAPGGCGPLAGEGGRARARHAAPAQQPACAACSTLF